MRLFAVAAVLLLAASGGGAPAASGPSLQQLAGQLLLVRMRGTTPSAAFLQRVERGEVGGVVLFGDNLGPGGPKAAIAALQAAAKAGGQPPVLVAVDQEGGIVKRLAGPPTLAPPAMTTAAAARAQGIATGRSLRSLGIRLDLAPVLDVDHGGFIGPRTFGSTPVTVAVRGVAFADGLAARGVGATAKHFPGLGRAAVSTDVAPTVVTASAAQLRADWTPFRLAARHGIAAVMLSTAVYPALGSRLPAAFSPAIVGDLRHELGFGGVVVTDALQTPAVNSRWSTPRAAVLALAAGEDMVLTAGSSDSYADTDGASTSSLAAIVAAARSGQLPVAQLRASYARVVALKRRLARS